MRRIDKGTAGRRKTHPSPAQAARAAAASRPSREDRQAADWAAPKSVFIPDAALQTGRGRKAHYTPGRQYEPVGPPKKPLKPVGPTRPAPKKKTYTPYDRAVGRVLGIDLKHQQRTQVPGPLSESERDSLDKRLLHHFGADRTARQHMAAHAAQMAAYSRGMERAPHNLGWGLGQVAHGVNVAGQKMMEEAKGHPQKSRSEAFGENVHSLREAVHFGTGFDIHGPPSHWSVDPILGHGGAGAAIASAAMLPFAPLKALRAGGVAVKSLAEGERLLAAGDRARASLKEAGPLVKALSAGRRQALQRIVAKADAYQAKLARDTEYAHHPERKRLHDIIDENAPETPKRKGVWSRQDYKDSFDKEIIHQAHQAGETPSQFLDRGLHGAPRPIEGFDRTPQAVWENLRRGPGGDLWNPEAGRVTTKQAFRAVGGRKVQVLGKMTPAARARRAEAVMKAMNLGPAHLRDAAHWYESVHPAFKLQLAHKADEILRGFTVSQANQSPEGGLATVMKVLEQIKAGVDVNEMEGGTKKLLTAIHTAVEGEQVDKGMAAKLHDFADSIEGKPTRTWMGGFAHGGSPYAADVHMIRAHGGIDPKHVNQLLSPRSASLFKKGFTEEELGVTKTQKLDAETGKPVFNEDGSPVYVYKTEFAGSPSDHQYWRMVEEGHAYANHLNKTRFLGKADWTPAQAQAMDWAVSQWLHGVVPADLTSTFAANVRRIAAPATAKQLTKAVEKVGGVVHEAEHGSVVAYISPGMTAKIGQALADKHGGATATWLSNVSQAKHRMLIVEGQVPLDLAHDLIGRGFTHVYGSAGETVFMASKQALAKQRFDKALDDLTRQGIAAREEMTQAEHYGEAAKGQILGRRGVDRGVLGLPGATEVGGRVSRAGAGAGGAARRLVSEERGSVNPFRRVEEELPPEPAPIQGPKTFEEEMASRIQGQKPVRGRSQAGYRPQRAAKAKAFDEAYDQAIAFGYAPREAHGIASRKLTGELSKLESHAMEGFGEAEHERLIAKVHSVLKPNSFERKRAADAINAAFDGVVPTYSDIALLERVFPPKEIDKITKFAADQESKWHAWTDLFQIPRTIQSSADVSALFRQALPVLTRHPGLWKDAIGPSLKALKSEKDFIAHAKGLAKRDSYAEFTEAGGTINDVGRHQFHGGAQVEEAFGSKTLTERAPIVSHSARQYTAFLNELRLGMWEKLLPKTEELAMKRATRKGFDAAKTEEALNRAHSDLARYVNTMTGRGPLPWKLQTAAPLLNAFLFSPRLLASRADLLLSPISYARATPYVRRQAMRSMFQLAGIGTGALIAASHIPGVEVGMDPLSSDFGRIKIGDTRIDIFGGFQPLVKLVAQMRANEIVSSVTGEKEQLNTGKFGDKTRLTILMKFLREKLSPNASFVIDWMAGSNVVGDPFKWSQQWRRIIPMLAGDIIDTARYQGPHAPAGAVAGLGGLGFTTMTYGQNKKTGKTPPGFRPAKFRGGGFRPGHFVPARP